MYCGLDFGTSNSAVALTDGPEVRLVPMEGASRTVPSASFYPAGSPWPEIGQRAIELYMDRARQKLGLKPRQPVVRRAARPRPSARPKIRKPKPRGDVRNVRRLYQKGVEHYARGEYLQATAMFMRILQIDPENTAARNALERVRRRR